ncbi:MAG: hypothetical protein D6757_03785 [Alphaproteobacteria bacterium]|nr:MAG: hypothetical protein D6757_03785 [Alphaproteobacteria bacterium]
MIPGLVLKGRQRVVCIAFLLLILSSTGCSIVWVDDAGRCHLLGFNHIRLAAAPPGSPVAGTSVALETIGISAISLPQENHFGLGYVRHEFALLRNDALIIGSPLLSDRPKNLSPRSSGRKREESHHDTEDEVPNDTEDEVPNIQTALPAACPTQ